MVISLGAVVWLLGLTQIVGYGTLYYSFAILAPGIAAEFRLQLSTVYGGFSLALLAGGLAAPRAGRWIDRHGAASVMAVGSVIAACALLAMALAPNAPSFMAALVVAEIASALVLYDAAFAHLVQAAGGDARRRITHLTLIAGFASSLFWPLTTVLTAALTWREIMLIFALMNIAVCLPAHLVMARSPRGRRPVAPRTPAPAAESETPLSPALQKRAFLLVTLGFSLGGFLLSALLAQMVPTLTALGLGTAGVAVAALFGPAQVLVRFVNMTLGSGRHPLTITLIAAGLLPLAVLVLALTAPALAGAVAFILLFGFGSGLNSIVRGTLPLALFGREAYGERLGQMAAARVVLTSAAPFVLAFITDTAGATPALLAMVAIGVAGLSMFVAVARLRAG